MFRALACLKHMVTTDPGVSGAAPVVPFPLEECHASKPTLFDVTFLAQNTVYRYVVETTATNVTYESLERITEKGSVDIFERDEERAQPYASEEEFFTESDHVTYADRSTRANRLFWAAQLRKT